MHFLQNRSPQSQKRTQFKHATDSQSKHENAHLVQFHWSQVSQIFLAFTVSQLEQDMDVSLNSMACNIKCDWFEVVQNLNGEEWAKMLDVLNENTEIVQTKIENFENHLNILRQSLQTVREKAVSDRVTHLRNMINDIDQELAEIVRCNDYNGLLDDLHLSRCSGSIQCQRICGELDQLDCKHYMCRGCVENHIVETEELAHYGIKCECGDIHIRPYDEV